MNKALKEYVRKALLRGLAISEVENLLAEKGWGREEIKEVCNDVQAIIENDKKGPLVVPVPSKFDGLNIDFKSVSASQILLYLGGLIVVLAGIIYIGINWSDWGSWMRIFAIFAPMMICYVAGSFLWLNENRESQGLVFVVVGSLLFPLFLGVTFNELDLFGQFFSNEFSLTVSLITFILYAGLSFIFKAPIWTFLFQIVFLFVYFYFWQILGLSGNVEIGFLFLVPAILYLGLAWIYDKGEKYLEATISYFLSCGVFLFAFMFLFVESFVNEYIAWILALFGFVIFGLHTWLESIGFKKFCTVPYFVGSIFLFLSLYRLAAQGELLDIFSGGNIDKYSLTGWSQVVSGSLYLLIYWGLSKLKKSQVLIAGGYGKLYEFASAIFILGGVFYLGLRGHKPIYETLFLITSLGFVFGSIPRASRSFLYLGTLFLIIYIFSIGSEYFQNDIGWPITLFIAGLLSMGVGVLIEKVKKRYFEKTPTIL